MTETPQEQIKRQIDHPDEQFVGGFPKDGDHAFEIEELAWAAGLEITPEGYAVPTGE